MALPWHGFFAARRVEAEPPGERYLAEPSKEGLGLRDDDEIHQFPRHDDHFFHHLTR